MNKSLCFLAVALFGATLAASAYSQTASSPAASAQSEAPELRVAAFVAPPGVMEQNGTLTGFSIDLWNAIAARLKVKTSYQIVPDVSHLEEALRSKNADLTLGLYITSARDEAFDFFNPCIANRLANYGAR
ncbi:MAG: transporter substrate-binding domain-containing protein [Candidatus Binatus sp.]